MSILVMFGTSSLFDGRPASSFSFLFESCLFLASCLLMFISVADRNLSWVISSPAEHLCVKVFMVCFAWSAMVWASFATRTRWSASCSVRQSVASCRVSSKVSLMFVLFGEMVISLFWTLRPLGLHPLSRQFRKNWLW